MDGTSEIRAVTGTPDAQAFDTALNDIEFRGDAPTPLWLRTPIQLFFIGVVMWTSIGKRSSEVGQQLTERPVAEHEQATRQGASS